LVLAHATCLYWNRIMARSLVLVAACDPFDLRLLSELCVNSGYQAISAADGGAVLDTLARERPALVMMEAALPVINGLEVLRIIKNDPDLAHIPVLLVTADNDEQGQRRSLELGADDYVTKPFRVFEIQQRMRNTLRLRAAESAAAQPAKRGDYFEVVDSMTGVGTTNQLYISLDYEFTRAARYRHTLGCIVARLKNYTEIEVAHGRQSADQVVARLASGLRRCIRGVDHMFLSSPEELAIVLPETDLEGCLTVVNRLNRGVTDLSLFGSAVDPKPHVSTGVAAYPNVEAKDGMELLDSARSAVG
jgi:two-component system cell cycle response regulator